jgi:hypothetical protein
MRKARLPALRRHGKGALELVAVDACEDNLKPESAVQQRHMCSLGALSVTGQAALGTWVNIRALAQPRCARVQTGIVRRAGL